jgi:hypothetical protein
MNAMRLLRASAIVISKLRQGGLSGEDKPVKYPESVVKYPLYTQHRSLNIEQVEKC